MFPKWRFLPNRNLRPKFFTGIFFLNRSFLLLFPNQPRYSCDCLFPPSDPNLLFGSFHRRREYQVTLRFIKKKTYIIHLVISVYIPLAHCHSVGSSGNHWLIFLLTDRLLLMSTQCRYYYLAFRAHQMPESSKENAATILERAKLENWVLGTTKVSQMIQSRTCKLKLISQVAVIYHMLKVTLRDILLILLTNLSIKKKNLKKYTLKSRFTLWNWIPRRRL